MAEHDSGAGLAWFLAGVALGAAGALLLAPASGEETRETLRRRAAEGRDLAAERGRDLYERGRGAAQDAAEQGKHMMDRGRDLYERGRGLADDAATRFKRSEEGAEEAPATGAET